MNNIEGKWKFNLTDSDIWTTGDIYDTKEDAIKAGKEYCDNDEEHLYVGQIKDCNNDVGIYTERFLEQIAEDVYEEVGEVAEDYLWNVKKEHVDILDERLNKVLKEWLKEFKYEPSFYKIANPEKIQFGQ